MYVLLPLIYLKGLPRWCSGKESTCQCRRCKRCGFDPWVGKIPWSRKWQPTPVFLTGKFLRAWQATVHGVTKSWTQLTHTHTHTHTHTIWKAAIKETLMSALKHFTCSVNSFCNDYTHSTGNRPFPLRSPKTSKEKHLELFSLAW